MECKKCKNTEFYNEEKTTADGRIQLGIYCNECKTWQKWEKQNNTNKSSDEYKKEYMEKQPATKKQEWYIKKIVKYEGETLNKWQASQIIDHYQKQI